MSEGIAQPGSGKRALATPEFLDRVFSLPGPEKATLLELEEQLTQDLREFLGKQKVSGHIPLDELGRRFMETVQGEDPCFVSDYIRYITEQVIPYSVHTGSPRFIGHMTSALPYFLISLSKCMAAMHQNLVKIETSRAFTLLERQTLAILHRTIYGRDENFYILHAQNRNSTLGIHCSGGTIANIHALWVARNAFMRSVLGREHAAASLVEALRVSGHRDLRVFASRRNHYSIKKACGLLGLGTSALVALPVDSEHRVDPGVLVREIARCRAEGGVPLAVIGVAGSTETGGIDDLNALGEIAAAEGAHFHVDAAWAGAFLMSDRYRHLLSGIEKADSVSMDGHKQFYVPMGSGMIFFKDPGAADLIAHEANYTIRSSSFDLGRRSLEGSRPGISFLLHAALTIFGRSGYELLMNRNIERAHRFAEMIGRTPDFEVLTRPLINILTYRYNPLPAGAEISVRALEELNELNTRIQKEQRDRGLSFVSRTRFRHPEPTGPQTVVLRAVLANPLTTDADLEAILEEQHAIAESLRLEFGALFRELRS
ncbi:MAG: putative pyridoxal-dependent aspartate 1-decarboxylase [Planctomycetes bacterium]|nr:putative pyridoxal-dependent aspartate 1-decarboxylase [Planctomycetota bacterium]